jgi:hypothetical protein
MARTRLSSPAIGKRLGISEQNEADGNETTAGRVARAWRRKGAAHKREP